MKEFKIVHSKLFKLQKFYLIFIIAFALIKIISNVNKLTSGDYIGFFLPLIFIAIAVFFITYCVKVVAFNNIKDIKLILDDEYFMYVGAYNSSSKVYYKDISDVQIKSHGILIYQRDVEGKVIITNKLEKYDEVRDFFDNIKIKINQ